MNPSVIGRLTDIRADLDHVWVTHGGLEVASHLRSWGTRATITDPTHVDTAARLRADYQSGLPTPSRRDVRTVKVAQRALDDYDRIFGIGAHS